MHVRILGSAAGGGSPQWNCACPLCKGSERFGTRTQDSIAVSSDGTSWHLFNASPDVRTQMISTPELRPDSSRRTPLRGILLSSAEIDHTLGLGILRENADLTVYATSPVLDALDDGLPLRRILAPYGSHRWIPVTPDTPFELDDRLTVTPISVSTKRPRYAVASPTEGAWVVAYDITDTTTNGRLLYAPNVSTWSPALATAAAAVDCVVVDGTFWTDDELVHLGGRTATAMGHVPVSGPGGMREILEPLRARRILTHLNNSNPLLDPGSEVRKELEAHDIEVAYDGLALSL